jgi:hypothetical protein
LARSLDRSIGPVPVSSSPQPAEQLRCYLVALVYGEVPQLVTRLTALLDQGEDLVVGAKKSHGALPGQEAKPGRLGAGLPERHVDLEHGAYPVDLASWGHPGDCRASGEGGLQLKAPALGEFHD